MYHIPTDQNGNIQWPDDLDDILAEHAGEAEEMALFNREVSEWTAKVHFALPEDIQSAGCKKVSMLDSDDKVLWMYCMDHGLQPNPEISALGPLAMTAIEISVSMDVIPHIVVAVAMFHNFIKAEFDRQQTSKKAVQPLPVEVETE